MALEFLLPCVFRQSYLVSLLFEVLAENLFFTRGNEFLWEYKVKAWIRDIKRKINSVFKTTYKFK